MAAPSRIDFAEAMAALGPFERQPAIAVGVSGGPDSMALAVLLRDWLTERNGSLLGLIVDHRLREGSSREAELVAGRLAGLGITSRILTRTGPAPATALQAEARRARYALLEAAAADAGILHLAVAHHRQDQLETVALRRASGSGPRGLAGMAPVRELERVRLIRPLLAVEPAELRAFLKERGIAWVEDPSNRDPRFWRSRHRARTSSDLPGLCAIADAGVRRAIMDRQIAAFLAEHGHAHPLGFVTVNLVALRDLAEIARQQLLGRLIASTGGNVYPRGQAQLARLDDWLVTGSGRRRSLGGVLIERLDERVRFMREPRAVEGSIVVPPAGLLWDGRFRLDPVDTMPPGLTVQAAGSGWRRRLAASRLAARECAVAHPALPATALATLPLVSANGMPIRLGPWPLEPAGTALRAVFRPRVRHTDVPTGHSMSGLVVMPAD